MCDEAKRGKAAEMESWAAACGNPNDYPNEMPPGDSDRRNWKSTREQPLNQYPWRYQELSDAMVYLRQSLRTILDRHGIRSNPAWADQEIIDGVADKLAQYARRVEAAEATSSRLALERDALQNRLLQQPREVPVDSDPAEALRRTIIPPVYSTDAWREAVAKEIADHADLLKELRKDLELRDLRVACIADDEEKHAQALDKMISDVNEKLGSLCFQVESLVGVVDGTPKEVSVRGLDQVQALASRHDNEIVSLINEVEQHGKVLAELAADSSSPKLGNRLERVEEIQRIASRNECLIHGLEFWRDNAAKLLNDQQESIEKLEGETHQHRSRLASLDELHTEHNIRVQKLERTAEENVGTVNDLADAMKNLRGLTKGEVDALAEQVRALQARVDGLVR